MFGRLFGILFALLAAVAGAVLGRMAADLRRQSDAGEPLHLETESIALRPRDVMPGVIAALRVHDRPWSYLHIPSWFAAFSVNFAFAALSRELGPLLGVLRGDSHDDEPRPEPSAYAWPEAGPSTSAPPYVPPVAPVTTARRRAGPSLTRFPSFLVTIVTRCMSSRSMRRVWRWLPRGATSRCCNSSSAA